MTTTLVAHHLDAREAAAQLRAKLYDLGERQGLARTKNSNGRRYDSRHRSGKTLNIKLDEVDLAISEADEAIFSLRSEVFGRMPVWHGEFDRWVKKRASNLAVRTSLQAVVFSAIAFNPLSKFFPAFATWLLSLSGWLEGVLLWRPVSPEVLSHGIVFIVVGYASLAIGYRYHQGQLRLKIDGVRAKAWLRLERKWNPRSGDFDAFEEWEYRFADGDNESANNSSTDVELATCDGWRSVLNVGSDATIEDIKSAYREAIKRYHTDRVEGLGDKIRAVAEEESRRLNDAYSSAKAELGFS